jgi:hypothetical protein
MGTTLTLTCDMEKECGEPVTHIDEKGFVYCRKHGNDRKYSMRCRQLTSKELKLLRTGLPLGRY